MFETLETGPWEEEYETHPRENQNKLLLNGTPHTPVATQVDLQLTYSATSQYTLICCFIYTISMNIYLSFVRPAEET